MANISNRGGNVTINGAGTDNITASGSNITLNASKGNDSLYAAGSKVFD